MKTAPHTIIEIVHGKYDLSILNSTLTLNQFWKGRPISSKIAKNVIFLAKLFTNSVVLRGVIDRLLLIVEILTLQFCLL